jgi:ATP-binding cassette subfamily F protein 3
LDEATTHLDKDTIVSLIRALRQYTGAVLLVSHDRHFIRCVIEGAPVLSPSSEAEDEDEKSDDESDGKACEKTGMVIYVGKGKVKPLSGGIDDYVVLVEKQMKRLGLIEKG